ncbi:hypothetical protein GCM10009546_23930 [Actinomadura livida]|uniref:Uncharacterized protein n=1 Tax=Actinomadura livida TaxID=79909 RepID=A0ABN1E7T7_9ACTN|nr:hypothetical protein GCM10010208_20850 [Actinomadura livida]
MAEREDRDRHVDERRRSRLRETQRGEATILDPARYGRYEPSAAPGAAGSKRMIMGSSGTLSVAGRPRRNSSIGASGRSGNSSAQMHSVVARWPGVAETEG